MVRYRFHRVVLNTSERLFEVKTFQELLEKAIPEIQEKEMEAIQALAKKENWSWEDYQLEAQGIDSEFYYGIPMLATYSIVTILHSIVETQLIACAEQIAEDRHERLRVRDMRGHGIDSASLYLEKVAGLEIKTHPEWVGLQDLQKLRNIIVHRGGRQGESGDHRRQVQYLLHKYKDKLSLSPAFHPADAGIQILLSLCTDFAQEIESFLKKVFKAAGFPEEGFWSEENPKSRGTK